MPKGGRKKKKHAAPKYVQNAEELQNRTAAMGKMAVERKARRKAAGCDDDDDDDSSLLDRAARQMNLSDEDGAFEFEEGEGDGEGADFEDDEEKVRAKEFKPKGVQGLIETVNLNDIKKKKGKAVSAKQIAEGGFEKAELSRREREELEQQSAAARLYERTKNGETLQAKKDLERLEEIRKVREEKKKARLLQEEANKKAQEQAAAAAASAENSRGSGKAKVEQLSKIAIKKMKPPQLKEALKQRSLSAQGNKKDLMKRLLEANGY